jgi:N-acetyl-gamma-glutamyl-phosphate reductase
MIATAIIGATGYTGKKLIQFCSAHPFISDVRLYAKFSAEKSLYDVFPEFCNIIDNQTIFHSDNLSLDHDVYFVSLPHGEALEFVPMLLAHNKIVIDLGGDYRLNSPDEYETWYGTTHTSPEWLVQKIYGLADDAELHYAGANLIANPGCYPTATLLSLLPLVRKFNGSILAVTTTAYSGTSGAGKNPGPDLSMSEMFGNVRAYNVHQHRHEPEILQHLQASEFDAPFVFTTHLLPAASGIYATTTLHLKQPIREEEILTAFQEAYVEKPFVRLRSAPPQLGWVVGTNFCDIHISVRGRSVVVLSAIDNLIKGAAGQAVQNLNRLFGWPETSGLLSKEANYVSVY